MVVMKFSYFAILLLNLAKLTVNFRAHMSEIPVFGVFRGLVWAVGQISWSNFVQVVVCGRGEEGRVM